jgi:MFS family permease
MSSSEQTLAELHWKRNLVVCVFGAFTTIVAMTLLLPFLPLYVEHLGVSDQAAIVQWSGVAFGATFFSAALTAPLWGRLGDRYGRKLMLIRASLGMAIAMSLIGLAENIWQLVGLRLLAGLLGGYASGATILVATQTPKDRTGWALGMLSSGIMAGNLAGPLIGGFLPPLIGIRNTFFLAGGVIFITFLATLFLMKEAPRSKRAAGDKRPAAVRPWQAISDKAPVITMLVVACLVMFSIMSIEPIITVYLTQLHTENVTFMAGLVMSATALASVLSSSPIGKLADRIGHWKVVMICLAAAAATLVPQAFVSNAWQLVALRFVMGIALGGLLPCIAAIIRHCVPDAVAGRMLGYSTSSQYVGQVLGPLTGGYLGGHYGMPVVFIATCVLMFGCAALMWALRPTLRTGEVAAR